MGIENRDLSSIEIRNLMLETLGYEGEDIDLEGNTFKRYGYQGTQNDLYRLMEGLAIKRGLLQEENLPHFHVTEYGLRCLREQEILPYDIDGYLNKIRSIAGISEWTKFYIEEALQCYNSNCMEAAVIMLGLSSEKIIDEQVDALLGFLSRNFASEFAQMQQELSTIRKASVKFACYKKYFDNIKNRVQDQAFKDMLPSVGRVAFQAYANFTRITRNELAHPSDTRMERIEVLMIFISFIKYCQIQYGFIDYYSNH